MSDPMRSTLRPCQPRLAAGFVLGAAQHLAFMRTGPGLDASGMIPRLSAWLVSEEAQ